jgi:DNA-binding GntR family transcriptional regulator
MSGEPLRRLSLVDELAAALRTRILDGELGPGDPLRELELARAYDVSRHTLRAALRSLAGEGIVRIEPNRGATVARLSDGDLRALFELRTALELEAAHLALERHDGRLPSTVDRALAQLVERCHRPRPSWQTVADAHARLHHAIVAASESPRIVAAYEQLAAELTLFLVQLRPVWSLDRMRSHHEALVAGLERDGPPALRAHLQEGVDAVRSGRA